MRFIKQVLAASFLLLAFNASAWAQQPAPARPDTHVVKPGDTLSVIARRAGVSLREIAACNGLEPPYLLRPGQSLRLSAPQVSAAGASAPAAMTETDGRAAEKPPAEAEKPSNTSDEAASADVAPAPATEPAPAAVAAPSPASPAGAGTERIVDANADRAAQAQRQELETQRQTTLNLINLLVESGVLTRDKAQELIAQAKRQASQELAAKAEVETKVVRVPYVPQIVRDEIKQELRQEVVMQAKTERWGQPDAVPEWTERIKLSGDIRLRYQNNSFDKGNAPALDVNRTNQGNGLVLDNTTQGFELWRYWARLGVDARISDRVTAGIRVTTGDIATPVSFDQTLGNSFNKNTLLLDRAFIEGRPWDWLTVWGGRMPNPWYHTDLVWDPDLSIDGIAARLEHRIRPGTRAFVTGGVHPIEFVDCTIASQGRYCGRNKMLYAGQLGVMQDLGQKAAFTVAAAYYDYRNLASPFNDPVVDPLNRSNLLKYSQGGNTVYNIVTSGGNPLLGLAADYRLINLTGSFDYKRWDPALVNLTVDYVENIGYNRDEIRVRTAGLVDQEARTRGYQVRLSVGQRTMSALGDWQVFGAYKYLQRDAVVDAFTDSDFALGGTDAKGYVVGGLVGLAKNTWVRGRWLSSNAIDGPPRAVDVLQIELNARF